MSTKIRQLTIEYMPGTPLSTLIIELLQNSEGYMWQGTAHSLCEVLHLPSNHSPRGLAVTLKKQGDELKKLGVTIRYKKLHGIRIVCLSMAHSYAREPTKRTTPTPTYPLLGDAKVEEPVSFPFRWKYGTVTALTAEEVEEYNAKRANGIRRQHYKHCQQCGEGGPGIIQFRKTSDGNASLLCKECAEKYVRNAKELKKRGV
jgi:hypothetical protein